MTRKLGSFLMILGTVLILGALSLFLYNRYEEANAGKTVEAVLPQLQVAIRENMVESPEATEVVVPEETEPVIQEMTEVEIDGFGYIGYLSIPALNLELSVMSEWDYPRLKISPCRYSGTTMEDNLTIAAHNYARHFGPIRNLALGDRVVFTDMDGQIIYYEVAAVDVLVPTAIEEVTSGNFDLTLFTCTYGGKSRVVVYCNRVEE